MASEVEAMSTIYDIASYPYQTTTLNAKGSIVSYTFPAITEVGKVNRWIITVKNSGQSDASIYIGIYNEPGNPGFFIVTIYGTEHIIYPGDLIIVADSYVPVGELISASGTIKFMTEGDYKVRIEAGHYEAQGGGPPPVPPVPPSPVPMALIYTLVPDDIRVIDG